MNKPTRIAFEGFNGVGKSYVIKNLIRNLKDDGGDVWATKIGGLAEDSLARQEFQELERKRRQGNLSEQEATMFKRDMFFRNEYKRQIKELEKVDVTRYSHVLFDRTPLMSWAYTQASDPNNAFLSEIKKDALDHTRLLSLDLLFVIEIQPEQVYTRLIARSLKYNPDQSVDKLLECIGASKEILQKIETDARNMVNHPDILPKQAAMGDFVRFNKMRNQMDAYRSVVSEASQMIGFEWVILENNALGHETVMTAMRRIEQYTALQLQKISMK